VAEPTSPLASSVNGCRSGLARHSSSRTGQEAHHGGEPGWIRKRFTADFLTAFHEHFRHEGKRVIAKVAKQQPAAYLRCLTMLVPKEMKIEHQGGIKAWRWR
jgi:hypothetical protein